MKKYFGNKSLILAMLLGVAISCDEQKVSPIDDPSDNAVAAFELVGATTVNEGSEANTVVYNITLSKAVPVAVEINAEQVGGTASEDDYTITAATIPAYATEGQLVITINSDIEPEETETLQLELSPDLPITYLLNPSITFPSITINIENYTSDDLEMVFAWDRDVEVETEEGTETVHSCDEVDFDIFIADAEGFDIDDPWATFNDVVMAATGDCPEEMTFSGLPDGSYVIFAELWANGLAGAGANTPLPITATFTRPGVFVEKVLVQDESQIINSDTPGVDDDGYDGEVIDVYVAEVTIADGKYVVKGLDGTEIANGRVGKKGLKVGRTQRPASTLVNK